MLLLGVLWIVYLAVGFSGLFILSLVGLTWFEFDFGFGFDLVLIWVFLGAVVVLGGIVLVSGLLLGGLSVLDLMFV